MLIEFRVQNFGCLLEEQVLSFVPVKGKELPVSATMETGVPRVPRLLRTAVLCGKNGSGKSAVLKALQTMLMILAGNTVIRDVMHHPVQQLPYTPFALTETARHSPVAFEISFLCDGRKYQYGFQYTAEQIHEEYLYESAKGRRHLLFSRKYDSVANKYRYTFGSSLRGRKTVLGDATRDVALFLRRAAELNSTQLIPVYEKLVSSFVICTRGNEFTLIDSIHVLDADNEAKVFVESFLESADSGISGITIKKGFGGKILGCSFLHTAEDGNVAIPSHYEADGIVQMLPFLTSLYHALKNGCMMIMDDIDIHLHPVVVGMIIKIFHSHKRNQNGAQLLCTTHDISQLQADPPLFRKDQIWFAEKKQTQASELHSLAESKDTP